MSQNHFRSVFVICNLLFGTVLAHEEPPKTPGELRHQIEHRKETAKSGIRHQTVWEVKDGKRIRQSETLFDRLGNPKEQVVWNPDGTERIRLQSSFNSDGSPLVQTLNGREEPGSTVFTYRTDGLISSATDFSPDGTLLSALRYVYGNQSVTLRKLSATGELLYEIIYRYPRGLETNEMTEASKTDSNGNLQQRVEALFEDGLRIEKRVFDRSNALIRTFRYTYALPHDDFKAITTESPSGDILSVMTFEYEGDELQKVIERDAQGTVLSTQEYEYESE
jgi:hypothetical protein